MKCYFIYFYSSLLVLLLLFNLCLFSLAQHASPSKAVSTSEVDARAMADQLSYIFDIYLSNYTGRDHAQALLDEAHVTLVNVDGAVQTASLVTRIQTLLQSYDSLLLHLRDRLPERKPHTLNWKNFTQTVLTEHSFQKYPGWTHSISLEHAAVWFPEEGHPVQNRREIISDAEWITSLPDSWRKVWKEGAYSDLCSLYFGGSSGLISVYPGREKGKDEHMDARLMPWFMSAGTPRKDVVFLLDASSSMTEHGWSETVAGVASVVRGLTDEDFMQIVVTRDDEVHRAPCVSPLGLTRATLDNKKRLLSWLQTISPRGKPNFKLAFSTLYSLFFDSIGSTENIGLRSNNSNCIKIVHTVSASSEAVREDVDDIINRLDNELEVTIHSWVLGAAAQAASEYASEDYRRSSGGFYEASCSHGGVWHSVSEDELAYSMLQSYRYTVAGFTREKPVWQLSLGGDYLPLSTTYQNRSLYLSASLPVYDMDASYPTLLGVLGLDISFDSLLMMLEKEQIGLSYAFLTSRYGEAVSHPRVPDVRQVKQTDMPLFYDISLVEPAFKGKDSKMEFIRRPSGHLSAVVDVPIPKGDTGEGFALKKKKINFFFQRVEDSPLTVVLALTEENVVKRVMEASSPFLPSGFKNMHLLQLRGETAFLPPGFFFSIIPDLAPYGITGASFTYSTVSGTHHKYLLDGWQDFFVKIRAGDLEETRRAAMNLNSLPLTQERLSATSLNRSELLTNRIFGEEVRHMAHITAPMDIFWRDAEIRAFRSALLFRLRSAVLWSAIGTDPGGMLRIWPGLPQYHYDLDPYKQTWFLRAVSDPEVYALSQPFFTLDENDAPDRLVGRVITISRALYYNSKAKSEGVLGAIATYFDYRKLYFTTLYSVGCPAERLSEGGRQCLILGHDGSMLMMPEYNSADPVITLENSTHKIPNELLFLGFREPELAQQLLEAGFLRLQKQPNYRKEQIEYSYTVKPLQPGEVLSGVSLQINATAGYCTNASSYYVLPVEGTNFHLIVFDGYYYSAENCLPLQVPEPEPIKQDSCALSRAETVRPEPECPTFQVAYEVLENTLRSSAPAKCEQDSNPELFWIEWPEVYSIIIAAVTAVCALLTAVSLGFMVYHRGRAVVHNNSPLFIYIIHCGAFLSYAAILLTIGEPSEVSCNLQLWIGVLAFQLLFGCLSVRTFRVYRVMNGGKVGFKKIVITNQTLLSYLLYLTILPLLVLVVWCSLDPLHPVIYDDNLDSEKETLRCGTDEDWTTLVFGGILVGYSLVLMMTVIFLSFRVRKYKLFYHESDLMTASVCTFAILFSLGVMSAILLRGTPVASFLMFTISTLLAVFGSVVILFLPKVYRICFTSVKTTDEVLTEDPNETKFRTTETISVRHEPYDIHRDLFETIANTYEGKE